MWRSLIHFVTRMDDRWYVSVPGWGLHALIGLKEEDVPEQIWQEAKEDVRCFAKVNTGEEDPLNLHFEDWEPSEKCDCGHNVFSSHPPEYMQLVCDNCNEPLKQATRQDHP